MTRRKLLALQHAIDRLPPTRDPREIWRRTGVQLAIVYALARGARGRPLSVNVTSPLAPVPS
jgi:hypothetical protein